MKIIIQMHNLEKKKENNEEEIYYIFRSVHAKLKNDYSY